MINKEKQYFGFKQVSIEEKQYLVNQMFSNIANKYSLMNNIASLGLQHVWKETLCRMIPNINSKILDVAGGTGDISFALKNRAIKYNRDCNITLCDTNKDMLKICKSKAINRNMIHNFNIIKADATKLPFKDNSFDYYTISFGIRNVISIQDTLKEAFRVLKPTGKFLCLEFSQVTSSMIINRLYNFYTFKVIPRIAQYLASNKNAYKYLAESIQLFPDQKEFKNMIQSVGFKDVSYKNLTFGIVAIHYGFKR